MKYVVFGKAGEPLAVVDTEAEAINERDKEVGRTVYLRDDDHPDVLAVSKKKPQ